MPPFRPAAALAAALVAALLLGTAACAPAALPTPTPPTTTGRWWPLRTYTADPADHGRADAEDALARGRPFRLVRGETVDLFVDAETGFPIAGFGCCIEPENEEYLEAYNATVDSARAAGRTAGFDLRPLLVPEDAARARLAANGRALHAGTEPAVAPVTGLRVTVEGPSAAESVLVVHDPDGSRRRPLRGAPRDLRVAFNDAGTVLIVEGVVDIETFDIVRGMQLQRFRRAAN